MPLRNTSVILAEMSYFTRVAHIIEKICAGGVV